MKTSIYALMPDKRQFIISTNSSVNSVNSAAIIFYRNGLKGFAKGAMREALSSPPPMFVLFTADVCVSTNIITHSPSTLMAKAGKVCCFPLDHQLKQVEI
jgi:hypothetical protein